MAINLAEKYSSKIDEVIHAGALTDVAVNQEYDFVGAQSVKVYSFGTVPLNNYNNSGSNRYGTPSELEDSIQEMTMSQKKSFTYTIDKTNAVDSPEGVRDAAKSLKRELDGVVIPYLDTYRLAKMATATGIAYRVFTATSSSNAYTLFTNANAAIDDAEMPVSGRVAFVTPSYYNLLKLDSNFIKSGDMSQDMLIKGQVGEADGVAIIKTPSVRMPAGCDFIITNSIATTAPTKIAEYKIHADPPGLSGHLVEGLIYSDAFILGNKAKAIAVAYGTLGALTATMTADAAGKGKIAYTGNTNGGTVVYKTASSVTAPALGDSLSAWTALPADGVITATSGHKYCIAVKDDNSGKCVSTSTSETVTVGA